tara:strand:+ start:958 stop:1965 length:1008 start_codon:yes stop_codon:yes gene_type:complete
MTSTRFIDLYAGIGGIRLGFEQGFDDAEFVFSNEIDKYACVTYKENFGDDPIGDITKIDSQNIPDFDVLLAGFPCQAFSIAGRRLGFGDLRGTHFFEIARILKEKQPTAFLLENVKNFRTHDGGKTFETIKHTIEDELGYSFYYKLINAKDFGVPQNRERFFMVGFKDDIHFEFPKPNHINTNKSKKIQNILEPIVNEKYFISQRYLDTLKKHRKRHEDANHGFGYIVLKKTDVANTLVLGGMGHERNLVIDKKSFGKCTRDNVNDEAVRKLSPREYFRIQGFPDTYKITVSDTQAYRQAANSVCVPVIKEIALCMKQALEEEKPKIQIAQLKHA